MQVSSPQAEPLRSGYIRGGGGVAVDGRRVLRVMAVVLILGLAGLSVGLAVGAAGQNSRLAALRSTGVTVPVTVSRCLGISSGVGMSIEYWQCRGRFSLDGQSFEEVLGGSRHLLETGQVVPGVVVPGRPASLYLASAVTPRSSGTGRYLPSIASGAAAALTGAAFVLIERRGRRRARA